MSTITTCPTCYRVYKPERGHECGDPGPITETVSVSSQCVQLLFECRNNRAQFLGYLKPTDDFERDVHAIRHASGPDSKWTGVFDDGPFTDACRDRAREIVEERRRGI